MTLSVIVAASRNNVIGNKDDLPWRLSSDLKRFKSLTMGHAMIMGRKTYESIGRLLPGRTTIILTRDQSYSVEGALIAHSLDQAVELARECDLEKQSGTAEAQGFVIGGAEIYQLALPVADRIYLTRVDADVEGDTFLPPIRWDEFELLSEEATPVDEKNEYPTTFQVFRRKTDLRQ